MVDHIVPPGYLFELRHLPNTDLLSQYNINLARQVDIGSQLRLRFKQEVRLLKKATTKIARRDQRIQAREEEIKKLDQEIKSLRTVEAKVHGLHNRTKNLKTLLEAEVDMKKVAEAKNTGLAKELESLRVQFLDLQVSNNQLSQQMDARLDKLSVDFDEELYPHMLIVIAGRRWVIGHGLCLVVMKYAESPKLRQVGRDLAAVEAYDPEADNKYVNALQDLKDLKYPLVDQLEKLKDAPRELIMAYLHLDSNSGEDTPSGSMLLEDVIAANISRAGKKKKCRVVCRTHGISSAYHAISDCIPVSAPTIVPRGLAILLADAATQTEVADEEDEPHPRLQRSISLPPFYNLEWK
ncbi:hypothetical protein Tco_1001683 [Tanacetum coccineum]